MFSGVSLNDVSVISFIRLPLRLSDIPHDAWYCRIPREISPDCLNLGADDPFIIAVVGESMSGKSSLVDRVCILMKKECLNMLVLTSYTDLWR
jgi:pantothenate kinase-related protein Tda10